MSKTYSKHYTLHHIMKSSLLLCSLFYFYDVLIFSGSERKPKIINFRRNGIFRQKDECFQENIHRKWKKKYISYESPLFVADVHWFSDASLEMNLWKMFQQRMNVMVSPLAFSCCSQLWLVIIPMSPTECQWAKYIYILGQ